MNWLCVSVCLPGIGFRRGFVFQIIQAVLVFASSAMQTEQQHVSSSLNLGNELLKP